jgi:hypothetical protein
MKVTLTKVDGKTVGYQMEAESHEDNLILGSIRNMQFWGFNETSLKYDGMVEDPNKPNHVQSLKWAQKQHTSCYQDGIQNEKNFEADKEGYEAYNNGESQDANPHDSDFPEHTWWNTGWCRRQGELERNI